MERWSRSPVDHDNRRSGYEEAHWGAFEYKNQVPIEGVQHRARDLFTKEVMEKPLPPKFKMP